MNEHFKEQLLFAEKTEEQNRKMFYYFLGFSEASEKGVPNVDMWFKITSIDKVEEIDASLDFVGMHLLEEPVLNEEKQAIIERLPVFCPKYENLSFEQKSMIELFKKSYS